MVDQGESYYIKEGKLEVAYTGLVQHNGDWYYVENGRLNRDYTGLTLYYWTWYYVENGCLNWNYSGSFKQDGKEYQIRYGKVVR